MEDKLFKCPRCGNSDPRYIGYINGRPYCRACLPFNGRKGEERKSEGKDISLQIDYRLSKDQEKVALEIKDNFIRKKDALIKAVTGAGKTELVYYTMEYALEKHLNVGFACPRRDVVIDLYPRLSSAFPQAKTTMIIGNFTKVLYGDIICLTTHQLYRFPHFFDLLIIDEIDAFPFKGSKVLNALTEQAVRGNKILLSATPDEEEIAAFKKRGSVFQMLARYHRHPLPLPRFASSFISPLLRSALELHRLLKKHKPVFFFVPTINIGLRYFPWIHLLFPHGAFVSSESPDRDERIKDFKNGKLDYLMTTSILERGVTVKGLQVIVCQADHALYTSAALIQIAGRAGRKKEEPDGEVIFIGATESEAIKDAIDEISRTNKEASLQGLF